MIRIQQLWVPHRKSFIHCNASIRLPLSHSTIQSYNKTSNNNNNNIINNNLMISRRGVQYEQSSATLKGVNKKDRSKATPWITKSTKDYITEADTQVTSINPTRDKLRKDAKERKDRFVRVSEETDRIFDNEMDRMRDYNVRRWRKGIHFFKRQGIGFTLLYIFVYLASLALLYIGFSTKFIKKEAAYECVFFFLGGYIDKEWFYKRIEAWGTYVDFGFAFVINEMLEIFRFPFMIYTFYTFRPYLTGVNRRVKASMFRWNAAES